MFRVFIKLLYTTAANFKTIPSCSIKFEGLSCKNVNNGTQSQRQYLQQLIKEHNKLVKRIAQSKEKVYHTYDQDKCLFFEEYGLVTLPATNGLHRKQLRQKLTNSNVISQIRKNVIRPWLQSNTRHVLIYGSTSIPYLERLLKQQNSQYSNCSFLVVDKSLEKLANASFHLNNRSMFKQLQSMSELVKNIDECEKCCTLTNTVTTFPQHTNVHNNKGATKNDAASKKRRIFYIRSDAMFASLQIFEPETVDTVIVPMPSPVYSMTGSYKRLVTCDFYCAVNRLLKVRQSNNDDRGIVVFTDCQPYASFMMEQLEQAKLIVPFVRKNAMQTYSKWLPISMIESSSNRHQLTYNRASVTNSNEDKLALRNNNNNISNRSKQFPQQRFDTLVAIAASKKESISPQAEQLITNYDYKRKYYSSIVMPHF